MSDNAHPQESSKPVPAPLLPPTSGAEPAVAGSIGELGLLHDADDTEKPDEIDVTPERILAIASEEGVEFFCDQHGIPFTWIPVDSPSNHWECWPIRSQLFRGRLLGLVSREASGLPLPASLKQAVDMMNLQAHQAERRDLSNRTKAKDDTILIDLGDNRWRMIVVGKDGWKITEQDNAYFCRALHQLPLVEPVRGGDPRELFEYVPVEDDGEELLLLTWLVSALLPEMPSPILLQVGQQGSAKTTRCRRLRSLADPSVTPVLGYSELPQLTLTFYHHAVPCFENVSHFSRRQADMFCRAVTGDGIQRRKLYTDSDEVIFSFRRAIMINGITIPSTRPDFLDRCIVLQCKRIDVFKTLRSLDEQFEKARPRLLGSLLDLLVQALNLLPTTPPATEFRMADFAHFGRAVARALGRTPRDFDEAYHANIRQQSHELVEDCPVASAVKELALGFTKDEPFIANAKTLLERSPQWRNKTRSPRRGETGRNHPGGSARD